MCRLSELGYTSKQYILNAANFGSPQNRNRVFVLSILNEHLDKTKFKFPDLESVKSKEKAPIKSILKNNKNFLEKYNHYCLHKLNYSTQTNVQKFVLKNYTKFSSENFVLDINYSGVTLTASGAMSRIKLYYGNNMIREMLPEECFRYMGFSSNDYEKVIKHTNISATKQIYLCGNSISIQVLEAIFKELVFNEESEKWI